MQEKPLELPPEVSKALQATVGKTITGIIEIVSDSDGHQILRIPFNDGNTLEIKAVLDNCDDALFEINGFDIVG